jgi:hypothetical protein
MVAKAENAIQKLHYNIEPAWTSEFKALSVDVR